MDTNGLNKTGGEGQEAIVQLSRPTFATRFQELPDWLQRAGEDDRQYYFEAEQTLAAGEEALDQLLGETKSLKAFSRFYAQEIVRLMTGEVIDPDNIFVNVAHTFFVGKQKVVQSNRLALPEFMLNDMNDAATGSLKISLEGEMLPPSMSVDELLDTIGDASMRALYAEKFEKKYTDETVLQAWQQQLESRVHLSVFSAKLKGHIGDEALRLVTRAGQGDSGYFMGDLTLGPLKTAARGMIVYCGPKGEEGFCALYASEAPGGRAWYEFASFRQLNAHLFDWMTQPEGRSYLSGQSHARERDSTDAYMRRVLELPSQWLGIKHNTWSNSGKGVLREAVMQNVGWLLGELNAVVPAGYRSATVGQRQYFTRLNTELKGLTHLANDVAALISYEQFAYELIKKRAEEVLAQHGQSVAVDPDLIMVALAPSQEMTLSQLIITEHHITEENGPDHNPGLYPSIRFLSGHPPVFGLLLDYLPGWSRTLRPGEQYIAMLRSSYLDKDAPGYTLKRDVHVNVQLHEMHRAALAELFSGSLDRSQYKQIELLINQLREPEPAETHEDPEIIWRQAVYNFHLKGCRIEGVYVFRFMNSEIRQDFLYTPSSPDGRSFRAMGEFCDSVKVGGLGNYYSDRAKFTRQKVINEYIDKIKRGSSVVLPSLQIDSRVSDFARCYEDKINQIIDGVDAKTTSLMEIVGKIVYDSAVAAVAIVSIPFAPIGLGLSAVVMTKAIIEGVEAYQENNYKQLFSSYLDCMLELTTMRIGKLCFTVLQKAIARQLGDVNTCMGAISACTGKTVDLAVATELMKQAIAVPDSSDKTLLT
jgi:hypothetical protein